MVVCSVIALARLFGLGHYRQGERRPGNTATCIRTVVIEANFHPVDGTPRGSGWRLRAACRESSLKRQIARFAE
jgi:hypothetical protein